jgi:signal transduction histidine kinase
VVEAELDEDQVAYTVSDNGPGIPKAIREKVFEPYFTTKGAEDGTGLGLAICRKLTEAHGGTITLNSSPQGTQVRVTFPYLAAPSVTFSA